MATNILAPTEYMLSKNDRQMLLASIPPKIDYPNGIVPFSVLEQASKHCPELQNSASVCIEKVHEIMIVKIQQERKKFIKMYGNDGVSFV